MPLMTEYKTRLTSGTLHVDAAQEAVAQKLSALARALAAAPPQQPGTLARLLGRKPPPAPRGIYIHGEVGRGKTMLMDMFFNTVENWSKWRIHFHGFMQAVHRERAEQRTIEQIAAGIAKRARLLCLDEMQIVDIADAMIVGRLYEALHALGVVMVTTSNLPPEGLYKDGLNRDLFLPFIALLRQTLDVVSLDSPKDYRLGRVKGLRSYVTPLGPAATAALDELWSGLTDNDPVKPVDLNVLGRKLRVPRAAHGCARFSFAELCEQPLGPPDYLALAQAFRTVFVDNVPRLTASQRNEAKRFILLIDTLYDAGTRLVVSAAARPQNLLAGGKHGFEFARTASRLEEMQSAAWWGRNIAET